MRILIYGINYAPEPIGIGKYTGEMAEWLAVHGHDVDVITAVPHYPYWEIPPQYLGEPYYVEYAPGMRIMRSRVFVPRKGEGGAWGRIKMEISFTWNSWRFWRPVFMSRRKLYDVVISICPPLQGGLYPLFYRWFSKTSWVFHIQDLQVDAAMKLGILGGGLGKILYMLESILLRSATRVSTITDAMKKRIVEKGSPEDRVWVFPNWTDLQFVHPMSRNNKYRDELQISAEQVIFMYAGNLGEKQGLELVVEAASNLRDQKHIQFVISGDGISSNRLKKLADQKKLSNLHFLPVQLKESLPELLAVADVHLVIQKREAADIVMPSKLTNILAAARPTLATADYGTTLYNVLTENELGIATPPEDLEAFIIMVKKLADDGSLREKMGVNARSYAERLLSSDVILSKFEAGLASLVSEHNTRDA